MQKRQPKQDPNGRQGDLRPCEPTEGAGVTFGFFCEQFRLGQGFQLAPRSHVVVMSKLSTSYIKLALCTEFMLEDSHGFSQTATVMDPVVRFIRGRACARNCAHRVCLTFLDCVPFAVSYILYDSVAAVSPYIKSQLGATNEDLGVIFASYSLVTITFTCTFGIRPSFSPVLCCGLQSQPNMVVPLATGVLVSRPAVIWKITGILSVGLVFGIACVTLGVMWKRLALVGIGRTVTG
jgi:hypothetical protein